MSPVVLDGLGGCAQSCCAPCKWTCGSVYVKQCRVQARFWRQDPDLFLEGWFVCSVGFSGSCPAIPYSSEGHSQALDREPIVTDFKATAWISRGLANCRIGVIFVTCAFRPWMCVLTPISTGLLSQDVGHYQILFSFIYLVRVVYNCSPLRVHTSQP